MDNRPVGIFDSGLGGLTAMKALQELLPEENIIYFGDTGRMPYGAKTREQVRRMAVERPASSRPSKSPPPRAANAVAGR